MKPKTWTHPKFALLQRKLGTCPALTAGILEGIWHLAATFDPDSGTLPHSAEEITAWLGVDLDADALLTALVVTQWVDEIDGGYQIHNWQEHKPSYIRDAERKRRQRTTDNVTGQSRDSHGTVCDNPSAAAPSDSDSVLGKSTKVLSPATQASEAWNAFVDRTGDGRFGKIRKLTKERQRKVSTRVKDDPEWLATFGEALGKLPIPNTDKFTWQPDFNWLIGNGEHVYQLVEGKYSNGKSTTGPLPPDEYQQERAKRLARTKAIIDAVRKP